MYPRFFVVGVTGATGAGKGAVCRILERFGGVVADCDIIAHETYKRGTAGYGEVVSAFGTDILYRDGEIDRTKLGALVFADKRQLALLTNITHKYVIERICAFIDEQRASFNGDGFAVIDAALLYAAGLDRRCDFVIIVESCRETRIKRVSARDRLSAEQARRRADAQATIVAPNAHVIVNDSDLTTLNKTVTEWIQVVKRLLNGSSPLQSSV